MRAGFSIQSVRARRRMYAAYALVWCALGVIFWVHLLPTDYARAVLAGQRRAAHNPYAEIDAVVKLGTAGGNAVIVPAISAAPGNSQDGPSDVDKFYFRGNYVAYPHRLFLVDAHGSDAAHRSSEAVEPSRAWMSAHDVHAILRIGQLPGGEVQTSVHLLD